MALRINRENEEDRGIEWEIEPCPEEPWTFRFVQRIFLLHTECSQFGRFKNATIGAYHGFEDVWIAPNIKSDDDYRRNPQVCYVALS